MFDPSRRRIYDVQYASIRAQHANTPDTSSKSDPPRRTSDQKSAFKEQMESLGAALQRLYIRRNRLENELFEIKREHNRSQAALNKLQREAEEDALEEAKRNSWLGRLFFASQLEEQKEERQRRILNNRAAQTVREAELNSRKGIIASKQLSIDDVNEQIKQKKMEEDTLQRRERVREEAVRSAETRQREAMEREKERKEKERKEKERREKERKEKEKKEKEKKENERKENERRENERRQRESAEGLRRAREIQRELTEKILRDTVKRLRKEQEAERFRIPPPAREAKEEGQANGNWRTIPNMKRCSGSGFGTEGTNHQQSARSTASKTSCLHRSWWDREEGKHVCEQCSMTTSRFAFRCPSCRTVACARCRDMLKSKVCLICRYIYTYSAAIPTVEKRGERF